MNVGGKWVLREAEERGNVSAEVDVMCDAAFITTFGQDPTTGENGAKTRSDHKWA